MSQQFDQLHPQELDFYGDATQRLEELRAIDYDQFKQGLISTHNNLTGIDEIEEHFVNGRRVHGGEGMGIAPAPEYKDELLQYALEKAQQQDDIQIAALIIGTAIVAVHPFNDGNGRTSRTVYGYLSRGLAPAEIIHKNDVLKVGASNVGLFDVHGIQNEYNYAGRWAGRRIYADAGIPKIADYCWGHSNDPEAARQHYGVREYHGLASDEVDELDTLLGDKFDGDSPGRYGSDLAAQTYAFSKVATERGLTLPIKSNSSGQTMVITPDALAIMDGDTKRDLIKYMKDYGVLKVKALIDLLSKGDLPVNDRLRGGKTSVLSLLVANTHNTIASRVADKPKV